MKDTSESASKHLGLSGIEITTDKLTSRAGLSLFARYLDRTGFGCFVDRWLGPVRKSAKGASALEYMRQVILYLVDGTSRHLVYFDELRADEGYAASIERTPEDLISSHGVKRFFGAIGWGRIWLLRKLVQELFIWRLLTEKPAVVILDLDVMVMENNEARSREGVTETYKKIRGFAPLQMVWNRTVVDAVLRAGHHHSNHKDTTAKMVKHVVCKIRRRYSKSVPIIIRQDSGYLDQKLFKLYEQLGLGYASAGKLYASVKEYVSATNDEEWGVHLNHDQEWRYIEFGDRRGTWDRFRRTIFCRPTYENRQMLLEFSRPDTLIYTNLGTGAKIDVALKLAGAEHLLEAPGIIECYHDRGFDELVHRAFKDFADQRLPFKSFRKNSAYYYTELLAFAFFEAFKADVATIAIPATVYATTFRRRFLDVAGKIVSHGGKTVLKVTAATFQRLKLDKLWLRCSSPPTILAPS